MCTREFNGNIYGELRYAFDLCDRIICDINIILQDYELNSSEKEFINSYKKSIMEIYDKYNGKIREICDKVTDELLSEENVSYAFKNGNYKENASNTYMQIVEDFKKVFKLEDRIHDDIVVPIWENYLKTSNDSFNQGDDFMYVVHSGNGFINLPGSKNYRENSLSNNEYISCSLHTPKTMDVFNGKVGIILRVNKDSLIVASRVDCGTHTNTMKSLNCVKINTKGRRILAGESSGFYSLNKENLVTKILTPKEIERYSEKKSIEINGEILSDSYTPVNEVVIDKEYAEIDMIYLQTNGCDFLLYEYMKAKEMEELYGKKLRIINKSVYRKQSMLSPYTEDDYKKFNSIMNHYSNPTNLNFIIENPLFYRQLLIDYKDEVIIPNNYESEIKEKLENTINVMINYANSFITESISYKNVGGKK